MAPEIQSLPCSISTFKDLSILKGIIAPGSQMRLGKDLRTIITKVPQNFKKTDQFIWAPFPSPLKGT